MNEGQTLEKQWIIDMVAEHCNHIRKQMEKHNLLNDKFKKVDSVRRCTDIGFSLGGSPSHPLGYVKGEKNGLHWDAKACQCTSVIRNEQGYWELENTESSWVSYTYCDFSYRDCNFDTGRYQKIKMTVCDIMESYPPLPESCEELPKAIKSNAGADLVATFIIDAQNGELAYIYYEHWGYRNRPTSQWSWVNPDYDAQPLVDKAEKEYGKYSLESAKAYELLYAQKCMGGDRVVAHMVSNTIMDIYYKLYGETSNEPVIVGAIQRDFDSISRDGNAYYYDKILISYNRMLKVKELHPEVDFPDIEELHKLIEKYTPLAEEEAIERSMR